MAQLDKIKINNKIYDISQHINGEETMSNSSQDPSEGDNHNFIGERWDANMNPIQYNELSPNKVSISLDTLFNRFSRFVRNIRWLHAAIGTTDISSIADGTVVGIINYIENSKTVDSALSQSSNSVPSSQLTNSVNESLISLQNRINSISTTNRIQIAKWVGNGSSSISSPCSISFNITPDIVSIMAIKNENEAISENMLTGPNASNCGANMSLITNSYKSIAKTMIIGNYDGLCKIKKSTDGKILYWYNSSGISSNEEFIYNKLGTTYYFIGLQNIV